MRPLPLFVIAALALGCAIRAAKAPAPAAELVATPPDAAPVPELPHPHARLYGLPALPPPDPRPDDPSPPPPPRLDDPPPPPDRRPVLVAVPPPADDEHVATDTPPGEELPVLEPLGRRGAQLARPVPSAPAPVGPERLAYCERRSDRCWSCAPLDLAVERPCERYACRSGVCLVSGTTARCVPAERRCCDRGPCERAPSHTACAPTCGDPDGDGVLDRCLVPDDCAEQSLLATDVIQSYALSRPPSWYRALCGPIPEAARVALEPRPPRGARERCEPAMLLWTIPAEVMARGASDPGGPGLCYGVASPGAPRSCGKFHCDTLRYCDGRERPMYCTVVSTCVDGAPRATGLTW